MAIGCFPIRDINQIFTRRNRAIRRPGFSCAPACRSSRLPAWTSSTRPCRRARAEFPSRRHNGAEPGLLTRRNPSITLFLPWYLSLILIFLGMLAFDGHVGDVAFLLQDVRDAFLHPRMRHFHRRQQRAAGVADAGQHVRNRIGHKITNWLFGHAGNQTVQRGLAERQARHSRTCADNRGGGRSSSSGSPAASGWRRAAAWPEPA
jgi:hypothetical protein